MTSPRRSKRSLLWFLVFMALAVALAGLQVWNAVSISRVVETATTSVAPETPKTQLDREKTRQELIGKQIENEAKGALPISLASGLSAAIAALATILGAILALRGYLDAREKEQEDRREAEAKELASREKERKDRLNDDLNGSVARLVATEWRLRVVGAAGLLPFFSADRKDFHLQAFTALIAAARIDDDEQAVRQGIRLAVEHAVRSVAPEVLTSVSWQGVCLRNVDLSGAVLPGLDLRDAVLENARFSRADLTGADLTAAQLQGAHLDDATLRDATLVYTDLAGATMAGATLGGATLANAKVLNLDLSEADLRGIGKGWRSVPWDATRNWRSARMDETVSAELTEIYGPAVPAMKVLMLMWEIPPMIAGGTWTACYHLVRNLRRRGADVTVVVPWSRSVVTLDPAPFGVDVQVVTLEIELEDRPPGGQGWSPYGGMSGPYGFGQGGWSPYGQAWSPYGGGGWSGGWGGGGWSPYGNSWSSYGGLRSPYGGGGIYGSGGPYGAGSLAGSVLFRLIGAFAQRLRDYVADNPFDLIHAHDWVTFDAARAAAARSGIPWIAHFHSIEKERQIGVTDPLTERIEQGAVDTASRVVAVSKVTRDKIAKAYDPGGRRTIDVVPNCLSDGAARPADMGRFETHRVVFLGRLSPQKGVDRFCEMADLVRKDGFRADFIVYGDGPERYLLGRHNIATGGSLAWNRRGIAFRGASAVVVPSRAEPFGMVILEAMQHRVPVIYPAESGAAEVLESGVKADTADTAAMASEVRRLLSDLGEWERSVAEAAEEIERYPERRYEDRLVALWTEAMAAVPGQGEVA